MPALLRERSCEAVHTWSSRVGSPANSIWFGRNAQRMHQVERGAQKALCKCRNRRKLPDQHGSNTVVPPCPLRDRAVGTPGGYARGKAGGRMQKAEDRRQGPLRKSGKRRGLCDPDGGTIGILPG